MATRSTEKSWNDLEADVAETFRKWPWASDCQIETPWVRDAKGKRNALRPAWQPADRRVEMSFLYNAHDAQNRILTTRQVRLSADRRERPVDNLAALAKAVEWMRLAETRGIFGIVKPMMRQMLDLVERDKVGRAQSSTPPPQQSSMSSGPYATLHINNTAPLPVVKAAYRALLLDAHPDHGGSTEQTKAINLAYEAICRERKVEKYATTAQ